MENNIYVSCNFVFRLVRCRISPPRIKLAESNFARWFIGILGRESHIFGNFTAPEAQNRTNPSACVPRALARSLDDWPARSGRFVHFPGHSQYPHVWIYVRPRRRTYLLILMEFIGHVRINAMQCNDDYGHRR